MMHTVYKGPEGETTQWDDIQIKMGNKAPKEPKWKADPFAPKQEATKDERWLDKKSAEALEELEDEFADDAFLEQYRCAARGGPAGGPAGPQPLRWPSSSGQRGPGRPGAQLHGHPQLALRAALRAGSRPALPRPRPTPRPRPPPPSSCAQAAADTGDAAGGHPAALRRGRGHPRQRVRAEGDAGQRGGVGGGAAVQGVARGLRTAAVVL